MILTIIVSLLIFGLLIISHEFGHFITAIKCGVKVEEFSAGMGPLLLHKETKTTQYSLRLFPIGGFCRMKGEDAQDDAPDSFNNASPWRRILILASGSIMNFIVAIILFFIIYTIIGTVPTTTINSFADISPARDAGMSIGDTITAIDGNPVNDWEDITALIKGGTGQTVQVTVQKEDGTSAKYSITPYYSEETGSYLIGITPDMKTNLWLSFTGAIESLWMYIKLIFGVLIGLFRGEFGLDAFSGPIGATVVIGQVIPQGIVYIINIAAAISVSLGLFNLLPIPAMDGSRIMFVFIELIKGSPVNKEMEGRVHFIGFVVLIAFAIVIAYKDVITYLL